MVAMLLGGQLRMDGDMVVGEMAPGQLSLRGVMVDGQLLEAVGDGPVMLAMEVGAGLLLVPVGLVGMVQVMLVLGIVVTDGQDTEMLGVRGRNSKRLLSLKDCTNFILRFKSALQ